MGFCSQAAFKNARAMFFFEVGRVGQQQPVGSEISRDGCPHPNLTPPKVRRGGGVLSVCPS